MNTQLPTPRQATFLSAPLSKFYCGPSRKVTPAESPHIYRATEGKSSLQSDFARAAPHPPNETGLTALQLEVSPSSRPIAESRHRIAYQHYIDQAKANTDDEVDDHCLLLNTGWDDKPVVINAHQQKAKLPPKTQESLQDLGRIQEHIPQLPSTPYLPSSTIEHISQIDNDASTRASANTIDVPFFLHHQSQVMGDEQEILAPQVYSGFQENLIQTSDPITPILAETEGDAIHSHSNISDQIILQDESRDKSFDKSHENISTSITSSATHCDPIKAYNSWNNGAQPFSQTVSHHLDTVENPDNVHLQTLEPTDAVSTSIVVVETEPLSLSATKSTMKEPILPLVAQALEATTDQESSPVIRDEVPEELSNSFYWHSAKSSCSSQNEILDNLNELPVKSDFGAAKVALPLRSTSLSTAQKGIKNLLSYDFGSQSDWDYFGDYEADSLQGGDHYESDGKIPSIGIDSKAASIAESNKQGSRRSIETSRSSVYSEIYRHRSIIQLSSHALREGNRADSKWSPSTTTPTTPRLVSSRPLTLMSESTPLEIQRPDLDELIRAWSDASHIGRSSNRSSHYRCRHSSLGDVSVTSFSVETLSGLNMISNDVPPMPKLPASLTLGPNVRPYPGQHNIIARTDFHGDDSKPKMSRWQLPVSRANNPGIGVTAHTVERNAHNAAESGSTFDDDGRVVSNHTDGQAATLATTEPHQSYPSPLHFHKEPESHNKPESDTQQTQDPNTTVNEGAITPVVMTQTQNTPKDCSSTSGLSADSSTWELAIEPNMSLPLSKASTSKNNSADLDVGSSAPDTSTKTSLGSKYPTAIEESNGLDTTNSKIAKAVVSDFTRKRLMFESSNSTPLKVDNRILPRKDLRIPNPINDIGNSLKAGNSLAASRNQQLVKSHPSPNPISGSKMPEANGTSVFCDEDSKTLDGDKSLNCATKFSDLSISGRVNKDVPSKVLFSAAGETKLGCTDEGGDNFEALGKPSDEGSSFAVDSCKNDEIHISASESRHQQLDICTSVEQKTLSNESCATEPIEKCESATPKMGIISCNPKDSSADLEASTKGGIVRDIARTAPSPTNPVPTQKLLATNIGDEEPDHSPVEESKLEDSIVQTIPTLMQPKNEDAYADLDSWSRASLNRYAAMLREESRATLREEKLKIFNVFTSRETRLRIILHGSDDELLQFRKSVFEHDNRPRKSSIVQGSATPTEGHAHRSKPRLVASAKELPPLPSKRSSVSYNRDDAQMDTNLPPSLPEAKATPPSQQGPSSYESSQPKNLDNVGDCATEIESTRIGIPSRSGASDQGNALILRPRLSEHMTEVQGYLAHRKSIIRPFATQTAASGATIDLSKHVTGVQETLENRNENRGQIANTIHNPLISLSLHESFHSLLAILPENKEPVATPERLIKLMATSDAIVDDFTFINASVVTWDANVRAKREEYENSRHERQMKIEMRIDELFNDHEIGYGDISELEADFRQAELVLKAEEDQAEYTLFQQEVFNPVWTRLQMELDALMPHHADLSSLMEGAEDALKSGPDFSTSIAMHAMLGLHQKLEIRHQKAFEAILERDRRLKRLEIAPWSSLSNMKMMRQIEEQFEETEKRAIIQYCEERDERANRLMDLLDQSTLRGIGINQKLMDSISRSINEIALHQEQWQTAGEPGMEEISVMERSELFASQLAISSEQIMQAFHVAEMLLNSADFEVSVAKAKATEQSMAVLSKLREERMREDQRLMRDLEHRLAIIRSESIRTREDISKLREQIKGGAAISSKD